MTQQGEQAIRHLHLKEKVWAYNPKTKKMELKPILHVWINHDHDLVDLTITKPAHGKATKPSSEVIHTNKKHPFLTVEKGFLPVGQIKLGMHVVQADGHLGVISGWKVVAGVKTMYNLEVAQDHTYTVGVGQWVVHNCGAPIGEELLNKVNDVWHPANRSSSLSNFLDHFGKHAEEVGAESTEQYLNKAQSFWTSVIRQGSAKGVQSWTVDGATEGLTRYVKGNIPKYIDVFTDGRINSFGSR